MSATVTGYNGAANLFVTIPSANVPIGSNDTTLMGRPGQPCEVAPAYVYLASEDGSYVTGQIIHVNGGGHISA